MNYKVEIAERVGVSKATIHNWEKSEFIPKFTPEKFKDFSEYSDLVLRLVEQSNKLKSRVNRKENKGKLHQSLSYLDNIELAKEVVAILDKKEVSLEQMMFEVCLWSCYSTNLIELELHHDEVAIIQGNELALFLIAWQDSLGIEALDFWKYLYKLDYPLLESDDFIGRGYEVMQSLGALSAKGAFFTPASLIREEAPDLAVSVMDPCAGTGTLLKHYISRNHIPNKVFLGDVDSLALKIATVNFAIYFGNGDVLVNTNQRDFVSNANLNFQVDEIYTNPPWGYKYSVTEKKRLRKLNTTLDSSESFAHVIYNALEVLKENGTARFILPESITNVKAHEGIRKHMLNYPLSITSFEKAFKGVMSNVVHLEISKRNERALVVNDCFVSEEIVSNNNFIIPKLYNEIERSIISKTLSASNTIELDCKVVFGLGVVTGNNGKFISNIYSENSEVILNSKTLFNENYNSSNYIDMSVGSPQQMAPVEYYKSKKLVYKFISDKLQFKYDDEGHFILNNLNFMIVRDQYSEENLVRYYNSSIANFLHSRLHNSIKVLKAHLQSLPLPQTIHAEDFNPSLNHFNLSEEELSYVETIMKKKK